METTIHYGQKSKEELIQLLIDQEEELTTKDKEITQHKKQIIFLEEYIKAQKLRQFANKSEKINPAQLPFFDEAKLPKDEEKILDYAISSMMHCYDSNTEHKAELMRGVTYAIRFLKRWQQNLEKGLTSEDIRAVAATSQSTAESFAETGKRKAGAFFQSKDNSTSNKRERAEPNADISDLKNH